ncbi:MAG: DUF3276 family protein [Bacteroidota bacterium]
MESNQDIIYSQRIRAGRRTYFVDVKATRSEDYYITITESKRQTNPDGSHSYKKHKIFLYKEDFNKFQEGLLDAIDHVKTELMPDYDFEKFDEDNGDDFEGNGFKPITDDLKWD